MKCSPPPPSSPRILILFESVLQLTALSAMLTANGFRVSAASDLAHALAFAERGHFELAIVDLADGGADRAPLLTLVRHRGGRVVAVTASPAHVDLDPGDRVEPRPVSAAHLLHTVQTLLSEQRQGR